MGVGGVNVGHSLSPPSHFMLATGLGPQSAVFSLGPRVYIKETLPRPQSLAITGVPQSPLSLGKACGGGRRKPISVVVYLPNRSRDLVFSTDPVAPAPRTPSPYYPLKQMRMRCVVSLRGRR